jgi:outer membrane protein OmpA-like peptidoglycan-associated protein
VLPPPLVVPTRPPAPPPPAPVSADAPDVVADLPDGLRVTFGADRFDLNPASAAALSALAGKAAAAATFTVTAYAAGTPDDPSTPRRLSLSRALTVRSVLMAAGVASVRIYVKALGASAPALAAAPPDRVDVSVTSPPAPAPSQKAAP